LPLTLKLTKPRISCNPATSFRVEFELDQLVLSCAAVPNFHLLTAFTAACASTGCPPMIFVDLTVPLGAMMACTLTVPRMAIFLASSGYTGITFVISFRSLGAFCCWPRATGWTLHKTCGYNYKQRNCQPTSHLQKVTAKTTLSSSRYLAEDTQSNRREDTFGTA